MSVFNFIPGEKCTVVLEEKVCKHCKRSLTLDNYHKKRSTPDGLQCYCKHCRSVKGEKYSAAAHQIAADLGLVRPPRGTPCDCCGRTDLKLWCDHEHDTKLVRGWICSKCNTGLGQLGDNIEGLLRGIKYLDKYYYDTLTISREGRETINDGGND